MNNSFFFLSLFCLGILFFSCSTSNSNKSVNKQPNVILIMSDDMGYSDLGCYGGEVNTPNLDKLASEGLKFTQFYNYARCCPTRASLVTGLYPHQAGIGHMTNYPGDSTSHDLGVPEYRGFINSSSITLGEYMKQAGYTTLMTGKWHLGYFDKSKWPLQRGFDKFYGIIPGASNFFKPSGDRGITFMNDRVEVTDSNYYTTDAFTNYAIDFIDESKNSTKPFFLYLAYTAPHWPMQAPKEDIDKYRDTYKNGWAPIRNERFNRMKEMGIINSNSKLSPQDSREWDSLPEKRREDLALRRAIYSAMIDRMDQNIGRLTNYLKENDLIDNTLIIFLNDNGACAEGGELGGGKTEQLETKDGYFLTYGKAWANASNTPFKEYKHWVHEGGINTPFIVHWPNGVKNEGATVRQYGFVPDIMATLVDVAGVDYPKYYNNNEIKPCVGVSLLPIFKGGKEQVHTKPIFWEHEGNKAVRLGDYKLVSKWNNNTETSWELYNLKNDRTEMNNLASEMPQKVKDMSEMYNRWAAENNVLPWKDVQKMYSEKRNKR